MSKGRGSIERIDKILEDLIKTWKVLDGKEEKIKQKIETIVGKDFSEGLSIQKIRGNKLTVFVNSPALYHELSVYMKHEISESLKEDGVRNIQFKLSTTDR